MTTAARVILALILVAMPAFGPGLVPATAEPHTQQATEAGVTPAIGWTQLGLSNKITLVGPQNDVAVPVPQGVTPTWLSGQIGSVINALNGRFGHLGCARRGRRRRAQFHSP
jgi:hypothetical protein